MAKTITLKLSSQIIADFESCFDKKADEKSYLYQEITKTLNKSMLDILQKKTCIVRVIENNVETKKRVTLDEIDFYTTEIKSNVSWETKDIAGELVSYEYVVGTGLWDKITNCVKLLFITNKIFNDSAITNLNITLEKLKLDDKINIQQVKKKEDVIKMQISQINESIDEDCLEAYLHSIIVKPILEKIKISEQILLDKEFKELNKPPTPQIKN